MAHPDGRSLGIDGESRGFEPHLSVVTVPNTDRGRCAHPARQGRVSGIDRSLAAALAERPRLLPGEDALPGAMGASVEVGHPLGVMVRRRSPRSGLSVFRIVVLIAPLLVFSLVEWKRGNIDLWGNPKPGSPLYEPPQFIRRPPTDRQLNFIDELIHERVVDADDRSLIKDPKTLEEASEVIDYLLTLPYWDHLDPEH